MTSVPAAPKIRSTPLPSDNGISSFGGRWWLLAAPLGRRGVEHYFRSSRRRQGLSFPGTFWARRGVVVPRVLGPGWLRSYSAHRKEPQ